MNIPPTLRAYLLPLLTGLSLLILLATGGADAWLGLAGGCLLAHCLRPYRIILQPRGDGIRGESS